MHMKKRPSSEMSAFEAISQAQRIAAGPMLFQTVCVLLKHGVLQHLEQAADQGLTKAELGAKTQLSAYGLGVLLDMALSGGVIDHKDDTYTLSKIGYFILNDQMTRLNFEFTKNVCYQALDSLEQSIVAGRPVGLSVFNKEWQTIYPHLSELPPEAKKSWFDWDHFYSDAAFGQAIEKLKGFNPDLIYDVGGNTGKFAIACCKAMPNLRVTILDLKEQIALAKENIAAHGLSDRLDFVPVDILKDSKLPSEASFWWMSQFLDCFSVEQVELILSKIAAVMKPEARICILEPFCDNQRFEAASYSLNAGSLYFTCVANGCSRFFNRRDFLGYLEHCSLTVEQEFTPLGISHTLLICKKKAA